MNFHGIKQKLIIQIGVTIAVLTVIISSFSYYVSKEVMVRFTENTVLPIIVKESSTIVEQVIENNIHMGQTLAMAPLVRDSEIDMEQKVKVLEENLKENHHLSIGIGDLNGNVKYTTGLESQDGDESFYQSAVKGEAAVSTPRMSHSLNQMVVTYAIPILNDGKVTNVLVFSRDVGEIGEVIDNIKFLKTGSGFMINEEGTVIADPDKENVINQLNIIEESKKDKKYLSLAGCVQEMIKNDNGVNEYTYDGVKKIVAYNAIENTPWTLAVSVSYDDILYGLHIMFKISIALCLASIVIGGVVLFIVISKVTKSILVLTDKLSEIATGNFSVEFDNKYLSMKDEIGVMFRALENVKESISSTISGIKNIGININDDSSKLLSFSEELTASMENIQESINTISEGNNLQSRETNSISQETTELSDQIDTLSGYINIVKNNTEKIEVTTNESKKTVVNLQNSVSNFSNDFNEFRALIEKLGDDVNTINSITSIINDVSEQTNLLALNAAIEAARAGESGKGFAVVAEEIRMLAEQSKENSDKITDIIKTSYENTKIIVEKTREMTKEMELQNQDITNVEKVFGEIVSSVEEVLPNLGNVYKEIEMVNSSQNVISENIRKVTDNSHHIASSSEEILAASNELSEGSEDVTNLAKNLNEKVENIMDELDKFIVD